MIGNISNLPRSIPILRTNLEKLLNPAKFGISKQIPELANVENTALIV